MEELMNRKGGKNGKKKGFVVFLPKLRASAPPRFGF